jgi:hypothetical protein
MNYHYFGLQMLNFVLPTISGYNLMSKETLRTFEMYVRMITETEYYLTVIDILVNYVEDVASTEFGERFSKMIPHLVIVFIIVKFFSQSKLLINRQPFIITSVFI